MHIEQVRDYCITKKGVTESFPFDDVTLVFKVMNKMFCLIGLERWEQGDPFINLKCDPDKAIELREQYDGTVTGAFHMSKTHWNSVYVNKNMPDDEVLQWIDHSYNLIVSKLKKSDKEALKKL